jgi:hypothetical protein
MDDDDEVVISNFDVLKPKKDAVAFGLVVLCLHLLLALGLSGVSLVHASCWLLLCATCARYLYVRLSVLLNTRNSVQIAPFRLRVLRNDALQHALQNLLEWMRSAVMWKQSSKAVMLMGSLLAMAVLLQWMNLLVLLYIAGMLAILKVNAS